MRLRSAFRDDAAVDRGEIRYAWNGDTALAYEVLVSQTVKDLVPGSGLAFEDRGLHELKGVPGEWRAYCRRARRRVITPQWPAAGELRIGLGCMRLSTDPNRDERRAHETIAAAVAAGITIFDTAHAYGHGPADMGHNEGLLGRTLRALGAASTARIVTKGGMARPDGKWIPDGRARSIRADCEASLEALDGLPIDLYLLHAPDRRRPWATSVRALARIAAEGLATRVGVANVNRAQLDEALELAPIAAVQVALSPFDDTALRGGVLERCEEAGIAVIAHSPLGGPRRIGGLARQEALVEVSAASNGEATPAEIALAWLLELSPRLVAIPGARRPETARSAAHAALIELDDADRALLRRSLGHRSAAPAGGRAEPESGDVVLVMGIPGAGKTAVAEDYSGRGYLRLNRDERGGSLRDVAAALDQALASGVRRVVLDNTYLTRSARSYVVETAARHGVRARCIWIDITLAQAQVNLVERIIDRHGTLPAPAELKELARREPGLLTPTSQMRTLRELEPPSDDEGFAAIEVVPFVRASRADRTASGVFVSASALGAPEWQGAAQLADPASPHLVFDWRPDGSADDLLEAVALIASTVVGSVEAAVCPHGGGAPACWCRPPLPGLPLAFARTHGIDLARSTLIGTSSTHRTLATTLGAYYMPV